jgi:hypothetical protein
MDVEGALFVHGQVEIGKEKANQVDRPFVVAAAIAPF